MLAAFYASGLSINAFAKAWQLTTQRIIYWRDKLETVRHQQPKRTKKQPTTSAFREIRIFDPANGPNKSKKTSLASDSVRVRIGRFRFVVTSSTSRDALEKLVTALTKACDRSC